MRTSGPGNAAEAENRSGSYGSSVPNSPTAARAAAMRSHMMKNRPWVSTRRREFAPMRSKCPFEIVIGSQASSLEPRSTTPSPSRSTVLTRPDWLCCPTLRLRVVPPARSNREHTPHRGGHVGNLSIHAHGRYTRERSWALLRQRAIDCRGDTDTLRRRRLDSRRGREGPGQVRVAGDGAPPEVRGTGARFWSANRIDFLSHRGRPDVRRAYLPAGDGCRPLIA